MVSKALVHNRKILHVLAEPLEICYSPFAGPARKLGLKEEEIISAVHDMKKSGVVRRVGAVIRHGQAGFSHNALVAWNVEKARESRVGRIFARLPEVSHCYLRKRLPEWPYCLYTMIHAKTTKDQDRLIKTMTQKSCTEDFVVLKTIRELKKIKQDIKGVLA